MDEGTVKDFNHWLKVAFQDNADRTMLERCVAEIILNYDEPKDTLSDVLQYGCITGIVSELIYFADTRKFYDDHYSDIETLRYDFKQESGETLIVPNDHDLKNWLAWWAFEVTCFAIESEWEEFRVVKL